VPLRIGRVLEGQGCSYTIVSSVATGEFRRTWRAEADDGTTVLVVEATELALKHSTRELQHEVDTRRRLASLSPDSFVRRHSDLTDFVEAIGDPPRYMIWRSRLGRANSLDTTIRSSAAHSLDREKIDEYTRVLLSVLRWLHSKNVVGMDISPHNLFIASDESQDLVLHIELFPQPNYIVKAGYSAPELAQGLPATPSSDLYSVAATALFLYTGINPQYLMNSKFQLEETHKAFDRIPDERRQMLRKGLSFYQADRYQTADEMLAALGDQTKVW
jgi:serine/threonine protein kinase